MRRILLIAAILVFTPWQAMADETTLRQCLTGSKIESEIAQAKQACTQYLAELMDDVRFGIVTEDQFRKPFCLPVGDLSSEQLNLIYKRFSAANSQLDETNRHLLATVIGMKAYKCGSR